MVTATYPMGASSIDGRIRKADTGTRVRGAWISGEQNKRIGDELFPTST